MLELLLDTGAPPFPALLVVTVAQGSSLALHTLPGVSYLFARLPVSTPNSDVEVHAPNQVPPVLLPLVCPPVCYI